jgi:hypothetical protein
MLHDLLSMRELREQLSWVVPRESSPVPVWAGSFVF